MSIEEMDSIACVMIGFVVIAVYALWDIFGRR